MADEAIDTVIKEINEFQSRLKDITKKVREFREHGIYSKCSGGTEITGQVCDFLGEIFEELNDIYYKTYSDHMNLIDAELYRKASHFDSFIEKLKALEEKQNDK